MLTTLLLLVTLLAPLTYTSHPDTDPVPLLVRRHWMREAKKFLFAANGGSPCPFAAFGAAIVNHTSTVTGGGDGDDDGDEKGELICLGYNTVRRDGNPTLHGKLISARLSRDSVRSYRLKASGLIRIMQARSQQ